MMTALQFKGVFPILITPFHADESLDLDSLEKVIRFMKAAGMNGVTVLGVLGEANRLTDKERDAVVDRSVAAAEGMPVVVGTSHPGTSACRDISKQAEQQGASAVMISPQREAVPSPQKIKEYFQRIADGISIPMVVQNHPASSQVFMSVDLLRELVRDIPQVQCIKEEQPPTPQRVQTLRTVMEQAGERRVSLLQGLGALYGAFDLEQGADGFMTGFAFPEALQAMVNAFENNQTELAHQLYRHFLPLIVFEQQPGLAIRKAIYLRRALISSHHVRHPAASITDGTALQLDRLLARIWGGQSLENPLNPLAVLPKNSQS